MKITWNITKKRGNWRPVLTYRCEKEQWENDLAVPGNGSGVLLAAAAPCVDSQELKCLPGERERSEKWEPINVELKYPASDSSKREESYPLAWRPGAHPEYPEVAGAMESLRAEWERRVLDAMGSGELALEFTLLPTDEYRERTEGYAVAASLVKHAK